jgi:signal transduction histidine kinase
MRLSHSDIHRIAVFVRKATKAPDAEAIVSETFHLLQDIARINRLRIVYSPAPGRWLEWRGASDFLEVRPHGRPPAPERNSLTVFFDFDNKASGYISAATKSVHGRALLEVLAPEVWAALLLRSAVDRAQKAFQTETELVRATLRARDEERRHIARELHDELGQSLVSMTLGLKWAERRILEERNPADAVRALSDARDNVATMLNKIRELSHTLYPRILDTLGLAAAVKELVQHISRLSDIKMECRTRGKPRRLGMETEIALYRCCQEAISNAVRHSGASKLGVQIRFGRNEVRVVVEDNGNGFDPRTLYDSNSRMMSSGFWTIRQRVADIGAAFRVSTAAGQGTVVELIAPCPTQKSHDYRKNKTTSRR